MHGARATVEHTDPVVVEDDHAPRHHQREEASEADQRRVVPVGVQSQQRDLAALRGGVRGDRDVEPALDEPGLDPGHLHRRACLVDARPTVVVMVGCGRVGLPRSRGIAVEVSGGREALEAVEEHELAPRSVVEGLGQRGHHSAAPHAALDDGTGQLRHALRDEQVVDELVGRDHRASAVLREETALVIRDARDELREIALGCDDAAGYFPALYARVTDQIARSIDAGTFDDGERMDNFATDFATRYTAAFRDTIPRPGCWQASWDVAGDDRLLIVQHLLLGINAHVNYDLPQTVVAIARNTGDLASVRADFDAVNQVLAATSVRVLRDLDRASRWVSEVASLGGGRMFRFSLEVARARAWETAQRLYPLDEPAEQASVAELDQMVKVLAYLITHPTLPGRLLVPVARRLEQRDPRKVVTTLLS